MGNHSASCKVHLALHLLDETRQRTLQRDAGTYSILIRADSLSLVDADATSAPHNRTIEVPMKAHLDMCSLPSRCRKMHA